MFLAWKYFESNRVYTSSGDDETVEAYDLTFVSFSVAIINITIILFLVLLSFLEYKFKKNKEIKLPPNTIFTYLFWIGIILVPRPLYFLLYVLLGSIVKIRLLAFLLMIALVSTFWVLFFKKIKK